MGYFLFTSNKKYSFCLYMIKIDSMHSKEYSLCSTFIHRANIWGYLLRAQHYKLCAADRARETFEKWILYSCYNYFYSYSWKYNHKFGVLRTELAVKL